MAANPLTREVYAERILRVLVHIQQHLDDDLGLDELAGVAGFSPFHFHRIFRGMIGETVAQHVRRLRLERAALALRHGERPVTEIAFDAGYEAHESFTRAFRAAFGETPSEFRARRVPAVIAGPSDVHVAGDDRDGARSTADASDAPRAAVAVRELPPVRVAFVRHVGPYAEVGAAWTRLMTWAGAAGRLGPTMMIFGLSRDDPTVTPAERLRYDACLAVGAGVEAAGDVGVQDVRGGDHAVILHEGPYDEIDLTYHRLFAAWLPDSGREPAAAPARERYLNDPRTTPPADLRTEVAIPLA